MQLSAQEPHSQQTRTLRVWPSAVSAGDGTPLALSPDSGSTHQPHPEPCRPTVPERLKRDTPTLRLCVTQTHVKTVVSVASLSCLHWPRQIHAAFRKKECFSKAQRSATAGIRCT